MLGYIEENTGMNNLGILSGIPGRVGTQKTVLGKL